ncbi:DNA replication ATP-dependent helicase/nuclease jhs1 [Dionaea muscipula]
MEHSAQVILYTILMSERYLENVESGLLYYLHTDVTQGTLVRRSDVLGLIMRRNELAHDIVKASRIQQLPRMLLSPSMCKGCHHLNACTIYHKVTSTVVHSSGLNFVQNMEECLLFVFVFNQC